MEKIKKLIGVVFLLTPYMLLIDMYFKDLNLKFEMTNFQWNISFILIIFYTVFLIVMWKAWKQ